MSIQPYPVQQGQTLYQADPGTGEMLRSVRGRMQQVISPYVNHTVRVQTLDGQTYDGRIAYLDSNHLYLLMSVPGSGGHPVPTAYQGHPGFTGGFGQPQPARQYYNDVILPLVLFELLVITLLS